MFLSPSQTLERIIYQNTKKSRLRPSPLPLLIEPVPSLHPNPRQYIMLRRKLTTASEGDVVPHFYCRNCNLTTAGITNPDDTSRRCPSCSTVLTLTGRSCDHCQIDTAGIPNPAPGQTTGEVPRVCPICNRPVQRYQGE